MPISLLLALSWRNLLRNGRRTFMLSLAVAVGVASLVLMAALLRGWLASTMDEALDGLTGHIRVHDPAWLDDPGLTPTSHSRNPGARVSTATRTCSPGRHACVFPA